MGKIELDGPPNVPLAEERKKLESLAGKRHQQAEDDQRQQSDHLKIQFLLTTVGRALGCGVHVAVNDRNKSFNGVSLWALTIDSLPALDLGPDVAQTIALINVVWVDQKTSEIVCAFEVEKSTSIYSGILRLIDLAKSMNGRSLDLFLVAPDDREKEILAQLRRPAFANLGEVKLKYILFSELSEHCAGLCKLGDDHRIMLKIAKASFN